MRNASCSPRRGVRRPAAARSTFCFHSAFEDESDPQDAPDRESIEVRTIVFYDAEPSLGAGRSRL